MSSGLIARRFLPDSWFGLPRSKARLIVSTSNSEDKLEALSTSFQEALGRTITNGCASWLLAWISRLTLGIRTQQTLRKTSQRCALSGVAQEAIFDAITVVLTRRTKATSTYRFIRVVTGFASFATGARWTFVGNGDGATESL